MEKLFSIILTSLACVAFGQSKFNYDYYDHLLEIEGTEYMIATADRNSKNAAGNSHLLFINTLDGSTKQIDFPKAAYIETVKQIKLDDKGINKVLVVARTVNWNGNKAIDWGDPSQIILFSADGQEKSQLTSDSFYARTWATNGHSGTIVVTGFFDANGNGENDHAERSEVLVFDLKTLELKSK